jgi:hypothetical protein
LFFPAAVLPANTQAVPLKTALAALPPLLYYSLVDRKIVCLAMPEKQRRQGTYFASTTESETP